MIRRVLRALLIAAGIMLLLGVAAVVAAPALVAPPRFEAKSDPALVKAALARLEASGRALQGGGRVDLSLSEDEANALIADWLARQAADAARSAAGPFPVTRARVAFRPGTLRVDAVLSPRTDPGVPWPLRGREAGLSATLEPRLTATALSVRVRALALGHLPLPPGTVLSTAERLGTLPGNIDVDSAAGAVIADLASVMAGAPVRIDALSLQDRRVTLTIAASAAFERP